MGHATWSGILRRAVFVMGEKIFGFMQGNRGRMAQWGKAAKEEVKHIGQLLPLCVASMKKPVVPWAVAQDSSGAALDGRV